MPFPRIAKLSKDANKARVTNEGGRKFLPYDKLQGFVTREEVDLCFQEAGISDPKLVEFVLKSANRLFLLLVLMSDVKDQKLSLLKDFAQENINDAALPIEIKDGEDGEQYGFSLSDGPRFSAFRDWSDRDVRDFDTLQYMLNVPVFDSSKFQFHFQGKEILPYLGIVTKAAEVSEGFFGEVSKIEIHPAHIPAMKADPGTNTVAIARKKAKDHDLSSYFDRETENLEKLHKDHKSPHLINPIAAYQYNEDHCLLFPWADGGNLGEYWKDYQTKSTEFDSLRWMIGQLAGIAGALKVLHKNNIRHGDMKPANILRFTSKNDMGLLQIADLGLARFHEKDENTMLRRLRASFTNNHESTIRYEPPEMDRDRNKKDARSRQFDIWSMGCIIFEFLLWAIYGYDTLKSFLREGPPESGSLPFWTKHPNGRYDVREDVIRGMEIMEKELQDNTAYKELLHLVRDRLLIVNLSDDYDVLKSGCRVRAEELYSDLNTIHEKCRPGSPYLIPLRLKHSSPEPSAEIPTTSIVYKNEHGLAPPGLAHATRVKQPSFQQQEELSPQFLLRRDTASLNAVPEITQTSKIPENQEYNMSQVNKLVDVWKSNPDNIFAARLFKSIEWDQVKPDLEKIPTHLCTYCSSIDSIERLFHPKCDLLTLQTLSKTCRLHELLKKSLLEREGYTPPGNFTLRQDGAIIGIEDGPNLLSIYAEPGSNIPHSQLGLPWLLRPASPEQFTLMKQWLQVCDLTHEGCRRRNEDSAMTMPTRLIELGETIRLVNCSTIQASPYVALSHCWGPLKDNEKFCAWKAKIQELEKSITFRSLPRTFQHAITVARGLDVNYIWIDSLCIIQDDPEDWERESARMEQVFSNAYCTIGASSSGSSLEGFLWDRTPRACVQLQTKRLGTLYVCPNIDDFHYDVEEGKLNRRGWVLQERALSRRSIFYSSTQVYWECGDGVQCETLARLHNSRAALMGDANFPDSALKYFRDGRQLLYQYLFEMYSRLAFTKYADRAVAILGLQDRLSKGFKTRAAYGFFSAYFARGLLWKSSEYQSMKPIIQPLGRRVPTWSFFSKEGAIKYLKLKFDRIVWADEDFRNPFSRNSIGDMATLHGLSRKLNMSKQDLLNYVMLDEPGEFEVDNLRCVVIGRDKLDGRTDNPEYHVLIVHQTASNLEADVYERVGVASLRPEKVDKEGAWIRVI